MGAQPVRLRPFSHLRRYVPLALPQARWPCGHVTPNPRRKGQAGKGLRRKSHMATCPFETGHVTPGHVTPQAALTTLGLNP